MSQSPEPPTLTAEPAPPRTHAFAWLPYARLLRLPTVFTALPDVALAGLLSVTHTALGPPGMGACRFCNVLLGLSLAPEGVRGWGVLRGLVVGLYIIGVTWFARTEARASSSLELTAAAVVMLFALVMALAVPTAG